MSRTAVGGIPFSNDDFLTPTNTRPVDPSRPSLRSGLSQPSQMGNFRHQSLRTNDRDKDRDSERERERDLRDREGQERLRHVSVSGWHPD